MLQLTLVVFSAAAGCMGWYASFSYAQIALSKVTEELKSVNETIHSNVQQFSLVPFTDDANDYHDAIEGWSSHFNEVCMMARRALHEPLDTPEHPWLLLILHSIGLSLALCIACTCCTNWTRQPAAAYVSTASLTYCVASVVCMQRQMQLIVSVNEGLAAILSDISGETMGALLRRSYRNDEYLQLMLLTTGYLRRIDEAPPWLCINLPPPLNMRHATKSSHRFGYAVAHGCVPVTQDTLRVCGVLAAAALLLHVWLLVLHSKRQTTGPPRLVCAGASGEKTASPKRVQFLTSRS